MSIIAAELGRAVMSDEEFARYKQMGQQPTRDMVSMSRGAIRSLVETIEQGRKLTAHCRKFVEDNNIHCKETVYQTDRVIENAYDFIAGVCEIVGYKKLEEDL